MRLGGREGARSALGQENGQELKTRRGVREDYRVILDRC